MGGGTQQYGATSGSGEQDALLSTVRLQQQQPPQPQELQDRSSRADSLTSLPPPAPSPHVDAPITSTRMLLLIGVFVSLGAASTTLAKLLYQTQIEREEADGTTSTMRFDKPLMQNAGMFAGATYRFKSGTGARGRRVCVM